MNRAERRHAFKNKAAYNYSKLTRDQKLERLQKNGITMEELKQNYLIGYQNGTMEGIRIAYAAMALALHDTYQFGETRIIRALQAVDNAVIQQITSDDAIEEVFKRFGFKINFAEGVDTVQPADAQREDE